VLYISVCVTGECFCLSWSSWLAGCVCAVPTCVCVCMSGGNTRAALLLVGPGDMEQQQPCLCKVTGLGKP